MRSMRTMRLRMASSCMPHTSRVLSRFSLSSCRPPHQLSLTLGMAQRATGARTNMACCPHFTQLTAATCAQAARGQDVKTSSGKRLQM